jgi:alkylglycerol monooxygenase
MVLTAYFLFNLGDFALTSKIGMSLIIIWSTVSFSGIFEQNRWYHLQEIVRITILSFLFYELAADVIAEQFRVGSVFIFASASYLWLYLNVGTVKKFQKAFQRTSPNV